MSTPKLQEDCVGITLTLAAVDAMGNLVSIVGATVAEFWFKPPTGARRIVTGGIVGDGSSGVITYTTSLGDLDIPGSWKYQGKITWPTGQILFTEIKKIKVKVNINE